MMSSLVESLNLEITVYAIIPSNMTDLAQKTMVCCDIQTYLLDKSNIQDTVTRMVSAMLLSFYCASLSLIIHIDAQF